MSKGRRGRRPGGHPARVALHRERESVRRLGAPGGPEAVARRIVREAGELADALEAELWASQILGVFWDQRYSLPIEQVASPDYALILGEPLIEAVARLGGGGAWVALSVIAAVDDGELGMRASELAGRLSTDGRGDVPGWLDAVGEAQITGAAVMCESVFDDAVNLFLEAHHPGGERHAVGVLIDNNLGVMAKDVLLAASIDQVGGVMRAHPQRDGELAIEPIAPGIAAGRIHAAIGLTDMTIDPPVSEDYARLRSLALLRADGTPELVPLEERSETTSEERDRLRDEFFASSEGAGVAPDGDDAFAVSLAIDFACDYVDGRPLRWSPVLVELFMADWVPRKVLADATLLERIPSALDAWVRFVGRKRGTPDWAVELTRNAIPRWRETMLKRASDSAAGGPARQFLTAAKAAGIDLEDGDALQTFIAGWNARSDAA